MLHKVILPSASEDKILKCDHSIESNGAVLSLACGASVSVWFRSKERPVLAAQEMEREPKNDSRSRSLLLNRTETLATQAILSCGAVYYMYAVQGGSF